MDKDFSNMVSGLLVIGNGFDLKCGLKSKFADYYDSHKNMTEIFDKMIKLFNDNSINSKFLKDRIVQKIYPKKIITYTNLEKNENINFENENISFWDFYFYYHKSSIDNWADVELELRNILISKNKEKESTVEILLNQFNVSKDLINTNQYRINEKITSIENKMTSEKNSLILIFIVLFNLDYVIAKHSEKYFYDFLFDELIKFENKFRYYLHSTFTTGYEDKSQRLLKDLTHNMSYNLLSFNYTSPRTSATSCNILRNIHGKLENHPIIGIDSKGIDPNSPIFRFTKTYRIITLASEKQDMLLPKSIKTIAFFGHSLAPADYSYFQSIFDYYNIYDNAITLVFYYSIYDKSKEQEIKRTQFNSVSRLINQYGSTFHNEKGENLMHKMLLEGRLILKEVN